MKALKTYMILLSLLSSHISFAAPTQIKESVFQKDGMLLIAILFIIAMFKVSRVLSSK